AFGTTTGIVSTAMAQLAPAQRGRERVPSCSFNGSFTIRNAGGGAAPAVDVYTWLEQPQGPQVGKISDQGYGNPALAPGGRQTWSFGFTLAQGSYVLHLVIDPKHLNKQNTVNLKASCGYGGISQMRAPAAQIAAPGAGGIAPSGGIGIARARTHEFMLVAGVAGESKDPGHLGWIDLLSVSWQDRAASGGDGRCRPVSVRATMHVNKASPQLAGLAASGSPNQVTIDGPGGRRTLRSAIISSVAPAGGDLGDKLPREAVSLSGSYCP
ncbi:MAG: type VI secretion system tube protein Hcp, partial [Burkholderiales bacterium]